MNTTHTGLPRSVARSMSPPLRSLALRAGADSPMWNAAPVSVAAGVARSSSLALVSGELEALPAGPGDALDEALGDGEGDAEAETDGLGDGDEDALGEVDADADGALDSTGVDAAGLAVGVDPGPATTYAARSAPPTTTPASSPRRIASRGPTTAQCTSTNRPAASGRVLA
jgi:hypothetical protein